MLIFDFKVNNFLRGVNYFYKNQFNTAKLNKRYKT